MLEPCKLFRYINQPTVHFSRKNKTKKKYQILFLMKKIKNKIKIKPLISYLSRKQSLYQLNSYYDYHYYIQVFHIKLFKEEKNK